MYAHNIVCVAGAVLFVFGMLACEEEQELTAPPSIQAQTVAVIPAGGQEATAMGTIPLPVNQDVRTTAPSPAFRVNQTGTGPSGIFQITNATNSLNALLGQTSGSGIAVRGVATSATGRAGVFETTTSTGNQDVLFAKSNGNGTAVHAVANGFGMAGKFEGVRNSGSNTLFVSALGTGSAISAVNTGLGAAGMFVKTSSTGSTGALLVTNAGPGAALDGRATGVGPAGSFVISNPSSRASALYAEINSGDGGMAASTIRAVNRGFGHAGSFANVNPNNPHPVLHAHSAGQATAGSFTHSDPNTRALFVIGASYFSNDVHVNGTLTKSGGSFRIDHPLDPEQKYLSHSFVESPEMLNVYDGTAMLDGRGEAIVMLPIYFESLNRDFRYQLTAIGAPGPNLHVSQKIRNNRFVIAGGVPGAEVSWLVTGVRQDAYAEAHRIQVETDKPAAERGVALAH